MFNARRMYFFFFTGPLCFTRTFSKTGHRPSEGHHDPEAVADVLHAVGVRRKCIQNIRNDRSRGRPK